MGLFGNKPKRQGESLSVFNDIISHLGKELGEPYPYAHENYESYTFEERMRVLEEGFDEWASHIDNDGYFPWISDVFKIQIAQKITCSRCKRYHYRYNTNTFITLLLPVEEKRCPDIYPLSSLLAEYFGTF